MNKRINKLSDKHVIYHLNIYRFIRFLIIDYIRNCKQTGVNEVVKLFFSVYEWITFERLALNKLHVFEFFNAYVTVQRIGKLTIK